MHCFHCMFKITDLKACVSDLSKLFSLLRRNVAETALLLDMLTYCMFGKLDSYPLMCNPHGSRDPRQPHHQRDDCTISVNDGFKIGDSSG